MAKAQLLYHFDEVPGRTPIFTVRVTHPDRRVETVGRVEYKKRIRHLDRDGWIATASDGSHRAVHEHRWQAAWALTWDGSGYPFPVARSHEREVVGS